MRVLLRGISLIADVDLNDNELKPEQQTMALALLAACALGLRRAGTGRNRGRGRLAASLCNEGNQDVTGEHFQRFRAFVNDREVER
jgi:hypothetical protein